jgi:hypothetical protein
MFIRKLICKPVSSAEWYGGISIREDQFGLKKPDVDGISPIDTFGDCPYKG